MRTKRVGRSFARSAGLLTIAALLMLSTGCWDRREINDLAVVLATGVDLSQDGDVMLSAQIFIPRAAGGGPQGNTGGSGGNTTTGDTFIRKATGKTIAEAMTKLQRKLSRHLFWGHSEVIVLGHTAARGGIREYMDFFLRYLQFREHAYVYVSEGEAETVLGLEPLLERSSSEELREMGNMKLGMLVTLKNLTRMVDGDSRAAVLSNISPIVSKNGNRPATNTTALKHVALFEEDKLIATLQEPESRGLLLLRNELETINFSFSLQGTEGSVSLNLLGAHAKLIPRIGGDGEWRMRIDVRVSGDLILNTTNLSSMTMPFMEKVKAAWASQLREDTDAAIELVQKELAVDAFGFAEQFRRHYPREWAKSKAEWKDIFKRMPVDVRIHTRMARIGKSDIPQGIPEDEVRKK